MSRIRLARDVRCSRTDRDRIVVWFLLRTRLDADGESGFLMAFHIQAVSRSPVQSPSPHPPSPGFPGETLHAISNASHFFFFYLTTAAALASTPSNVFVPRERAFAPFISIRLIDRKRIVCGCNAQGCAILAATSNLDPLVEIIKSSARFLVYASICETRISFRAVDTCIDRTRIKDLAARLTSREKQTRLSRELPLTMLLTLAAFLLNPKLLLL